jgi:hypothetical protein
MSPPEANGHDPGPSPDPVERVAYAIGQVIARKTLAADPRMRRLDALGAASAVHTLALNMVPQLQEEAVAALEMARRVGVADG